MTDGKGQGQADKKAAEDRTAEVAAEQEVEQTVGTDQPGPRADSAPERREVDAHLDPFPDYGTAELDELRSLVSERGVEINRDVEKAQLIKQLRDADIKAFERGRAVEQPEGNVYASYDVVPLEKLRELAKRRDVALDEDFERAHLITELRAADTSGGVGVEINLADGSKK